MEYQNSYTSNRGLVTSTSRQHYTRRLPSKINPSSSIQLDKIFKIYANSNQNKGVPKIVRFKTEVKEDDSAQERDRLKKQIKQKLEILLRKGNKAYKLLFDNYQNLKFSSSKEVLLENQIIFYSNFVLLVHNQIKNIQSNTNRVKEVEENTIKKDRRLEFQNLKLYKENSILKQKLLQNLDLQEKQLYNFEVKNIKTIHEIQKNSENIFQKLESKEKLNEENKRLNNKIQKLQRLLNDTKKQNENLHVMMSEYQQQQKKLVEQVNELKSSNQNLCEEIIRVRQNYQQKNSKVQQWKFIMSMQREEVFSYRNQIKDLRRQIHNLQRKYKITLKRVAKSNHSIVHTKSPEIQKAYFQLFSEQLSSFQKIIFSNQSKLSFTVDKSSRELPHPNGVISSNTYKKCFTDKETVTNQNGIKKMSKEYYTYFKPTFFVFLEKYYEAQSVDKTNFEHIELQTNTHFLATLRAILDSKHNQFLISRNHNKSISNFSTFCFSWLNTFTLDKKSKKIIESGCDINFQEVGTFYAMLMSCKLNNNWQIITFREFLLQTLTMDQMLFYLRTRYVLFEGDMIDSLKGVFTDIYLIKYYDAMVLIQRFVSDLEYRKKLEEYLKRSIQYQRKKQFIDAHYVLRLLLEYYQHKKQKICSNIHKHFQNRFRQKFSHIPFEAYLKLFDYDFTELTLIEKAEIYQRCYSLSKGQITIEIILTVLNEEKYFCYEAQKMLKTDTKIQKTYDKANLLETNLNYTLSYPYKQIYQAEISYEKISLSNLKGEVSSLGLEIMNKCKNKCEELTFQNLVYRVQFLHELCFYNLQKMFLNQKIKHQDFLQILPQTLQYSKELIKCTIEKRKIIDLLQITKINNAASLIMRFYKRRKREINHVYLTGPEAKSKDLEKTRQIREQFNNLIDGLKKKYKQGKSKKQLID